MPLALAVVPAWLTPEVRRALDACPRVAILQHGWSHADHAAPGQKKIELGGARDLPRILDDLARGKERLANELGVGHHAVLVPPWNRISTKVAAALPGLGFGGLSTFGAHDAGIEGLVQHNATIDPIAWHKDRSFADTENLARMVREQLAGRADRPIGLLTHHLDMDEAAFRSCETVLEALRRHENTRWPTSRELFARPNRAPMS
ncbi:MAG: hypothetical protein KDE35_09805 [Geminicoccaceae bacterium]|nr:hypothetical protein [Geminicoccaceae bacterium]